MDKDKIISDFSKYMLGKPNGHKKTATEVSMYDELQERNKLVMDTLKELQTTLIKLNSLITILITPAIDYNKEFKFKV